tara:strand:- start:36413 stop:36847 length:435 start_codon:yes stop_codon:yes gene_type:complete
MKKILATTTLALMLGTSAFAAHGPSGCGLGSVVFKDKSGLMWNVLAATTNGSSGNQTFGMSTGTLGCEDAAKASVASVSFIEDNRMALANDIARGEGETLDAYLKLIKAEKAERQALRMNYKAIFSKGQTSEQIHASIQDVIRG